MHTCGTEMETSGVLFGGLFCLRAGSLIFCSARSSFKEETWQNDNDNDHLFMKISKRECFIFWDLFISDG